ncbi:RNA 2'-phosphotransferase [Microbacterium sp. NPDC056003]|uniref:RNA 2'-phosphotransferase n=1 Tax=Microbacterium sp. NPDC056003 TaxID=3345676 RepID=UPI0035D64B71
MSIGLVEAFRETPRSARGVRFPFGLRSPHLEPPELLVDAASTILKRIRVSKRSGEFVFRDIAAELESFLARRVADPKYAEALLEDAIRTRIGGPRNQPLKGWRQELALAEDRLLLARLAQRPSVRLEAVRFLVSDAGRDDQALATRFAVLAADVESGGPVVGGLSGVDADMLVALRSGDSDYLFGMAARHALDSHDVTRVTLGGRNGVLALSDLDNANGHTFVFKRQTAQGQTRDSRRSASLKSAVTLASRRDQFGLVDHLATIPAAASTDEVLSIRRFSRGTTLHDHIIRVGALARPEVMSAAQYLAVIHAHEMPEAQPDGMRRTIKESELGRWLRALFNQEQANNIFNAWWELVADAPPIPRRDAHGLNWLVEPSGTIVALDFDAQGCRPFGYELAQLLEDCPVFPGDDLQSRLAALDLYRAELKSTAPGASWPDTSAAERFFGAGLIARVVQVLTNPTAPRDQKLASGELLVALGAVESLIPRVSPLAKTLSARWAQVTGMSSTGLRPVMSDADRRRLSRTMAYHLRHNPAAPTSREGWVDVRELADLMFAAGHKVGPDQIRYIAGALGETRFELDGDDVRALYGHSNRATIPYVRRDTPPALFHATPLRNLNSVLEALDGLRPVGRQWVHLTENVSVAMQSSKRHHGPIAVLEVDSSAIEVFHASGPVWLTARVPASSLKIVTLERLRELVDDGHRTGSDYL